MRDLRKAAEDPSILAEVFSLKDATNGRSLLHAAVDRSELGYVTQLHLAEGRLGRRILIDMRDDQGGTALHLAVEGASPSVEIIRALLDAKIAIDATTADSRRTALHQAAVMGKSECVQVLLAAGADKDLGDADDLTPLALATKFGQLDTVMILLEAQANASKKMDGRRLRQHFKEKGWTKALELLSNRTALAVKQTALEEWRRANPFAQALSRGERRLVVMKEAAQVASVVERIRAREHQLSDEGSYFEGDHHPHRWLFRALSYVLNPAACDSTDVDQALRTYEGMVGPEVNMMYYVVSAHLAANLSHPELAAALIDEVTRLGGGDLLTGAAPGLLLMRVLVYVRRLTWYIPVTYLCGQMPIKRLIACQNAAFGR
jgi:hypothetical protein